MAVKFFSSWEVYTKGIRSLIAAANLRNDAEVWSGADGSYAVGDAADMAEAEEEAGVEFSDAGEVSDYVDQPWNEVIVYENDGRWHTEIDPL